MNPGTHRRPSPGESIAVPGGKVVERVGDLFLSGADVIAQGVNTVGLMGAGVARGVRDRFPDAYREYRDRCRGGRLQPGGAHVWVPPGDAGLPILVNLATQDRPGRHARVAWLRGALDTAQSVLGGLTARPIRRMALPRIGCGIGGLQWSQVLPVLDSFAGRIWFTVEVWTPE